MDPVLPITFLLGALIAFLLFNNYFRRRRSEVVSTAKPELQPNPNPPEPSQPSMEFRSDPHSHRASDKASASGGKYEVFLSFRGKDTRFSFTDHLYTNLDAAGIHTFRDDNELRPGEEIGSELLKAIMESKIYIPIFSRDYASSKWCLKELAQMVECKRTMRQKIIIPIFYHVKPSDVKHQRGSYEEAFRQHEECFTPEKTVTTVQGWKKALSEVGELKGWELKKETHEGELVKEVVKKVSSELQKNYMVVTDSLVGIEQHVEELMRILYVDSNDVRIVGIHGMGGIGKTTIAKVIYNKLSEHFECCCFLADVRETSQQGNGLVNLQKQLISKIIKGECPDIANDDGINMIKRTVCRKKVLIVLDDVEAEFQFKKIAGERDWYSLGSRIIVTTRNKEALDVLEVDERYEPQSMNLDHSLQLFRNHAFKEEFPPEDYDNISKEIVSTCGGLPLALEIIGSSLSQKKKAIWEDTSRKLKKIPNGHVQKKLRISYEALDYEQKQIFLDIACLFIGMDKRIASYMWKDCEFYPENAIDVLVHRSLVKIEDYNKLWMHDQLRSLGREIVREENYKKPGERSRLWDSKEALDTLKEKTVTENVEALRLGQFDELRFRPEEFGRLQNLRFLQLYRVELDGDIKNLLPKLRWLSWQNWSWPCMLPIKLTNFHLKNLVILDLSQGDLTDNWETWSQFKVLKKLKVLKLTQCKGLSRAPDFSAFATLEILILDGCLELERLPNLSKLKNLSELDLSNCSELVEIQGLGELESLTRLDVSECRKLAEIEGLGVLKSLEKLDMSWCKSVERLPDLSSLGMLKEITLSGCEKIEGLGVLKSLEKLDMSSCKSLLRFPDLSKLKNLSHLKLGDCFEQVEIQGLGELESLTILDIIYCGKLAKLDGIEQLESLRDLSIPGCRSLERLPDLSNLKKLQTLKTKGCKKLIEIQALDRLESLQYLNMGGCISIERLPDLSNLKKLKTLNTKGWQKLIEIQGLGRLESLVLLKMDGCISIERLPDLSNLKKLKTLNTKGCKKLIEIQGLDRLESLFLLNMDGCISVERLPDLSNLKKLLLLNTKGCKKLIEIQGLDRLESLHYLNMDGCISIKRLPDLSNLKESRTLNIPRELTVNELMLLQMYRVERSKLPEVEFLGFSKSL